MWKADEKNGEWILIYDGNNELPKSFLDSVSFRLQSVLGGFSQEEGTNNYIHTIRSREEAEIVVEAAVQWLNGITDYSDRYGIDLAFLVECIGFYQLVYGWRKAMSEATTELPEAMAEPQGAAGSWGKIHM